MDSFGCSLCYWVSLLHWDSEETVASSAMTNMSSQGNVSEHVLTMIVLIPKNKQIHQARSSPISPLYRMTFLTDRGVLSPKKRSLLLQWDFVNYFLLLCVTCEWWYVVLVCLWSSAVFHSQPHTVSAMAWQAGVVVCEEFYIVPLWWVQFWHWPCLILSSFIVI